MEPHRDGFLVTNAHHNRVLRVRQNGDISVFTDFNANVVPTGLERVGNAVLVGPLPHTPEAGQVARLRRGRSSCAARLGRPLLVDVEIGQRNRYTGSRRVTGRTGARKVPQPSPNPGYLMLANRHSQFRSVVSELDRPTTFELIGKTAYVITITGKVLRITGLNR